MPPQQTEPQSSVNHSPASSADSRILDYETAPTSLSSARASASAAATVTAPTSARTSPTVSVFPAPAKTSPTVSVFPAPVKTSPRVSVFPQPRPATAGGTTVSNIRIDKEPLISPALTGFTFNLDPTPSTTLESASHTDSHKEVENSYPELSSINFSDPFDFSFSKPRPHAVTRPAVRAVQGSKESNNINYNVMAASSDYAPHNAPPPPPPPPQGISRTESASRRVDYFNKAFSSSAAMSPKEDARERVQKESPIIAELKTNVIIKDEYTAITSLSQHLSERYRRPESAILITMTHSTCLMMGGSFEPAYILDITAIPSEVLPTTNKRNAYLIQCFVAEVLHVPSSRGVVRFSGLGEENMATNGTTVLGDIERAERDAIAAAGGRDEPNGGLIRSLTSKSSRMSLIGGNDKRKSLGAAATASAHAERENRKSILQQDNHNRKSILQDTHNRKSILQDNRRNTLHTTSSDNRKSLVKSSAGERKSIFLDGKDTVIQTIERKFSTRSLRSVKSLKDSISPPIPTEFPAELLPSPTSIQFSMSGSPTNAHFKNVDLPKIHRLSPLHHLGRSGSNNGTANAKERDASTPQPPPSPSPLSQNPPHTSAPQLPPLTPSPSPPEMTRAGTEKEPMVTGTNRRPQSSSGTMSPRPQSARKNLSNITGRAGAIPSPPPIPADSTLDAHAPQRRKSLGKRKSFVSLFSRKASHETRA